MISSYARGTPPRQVIEAIHAVMCRRQQSTKPNARAKRRVKCLPVLEFIDRNRDDFYI
jgi:hypothetical protein